MQPLIKGYGVGESFLITKCFDCSNQLFKNKDVIIFKHEERIRIINDLFGSPKDIGCYYFDFNELAVNYEYRNDKRVAVIRCENFEMVLGMRAKPYILKIIKEAK